MKSSINHNRKGVKHEVHVISKFEIWTSAVKIKCQQICIKSNFEIAEIISPLFLEEIAIWNEMRILSSSVIGNSQKYLWHQKWLEEIKNYKNTVKT